MGNDDAISFVVSKCDSATTRPAGGAIECVEMYMRVDAATVQWTTLLYSYSDPARRTHGVHLSSTPAVPGCPGGPAAG